MCSRKSGVSFGWPELHMLRIAFSLPFSIILLIAVSGCVGLGLEKARKSPPPDRAYMNVLYEGYLELSDAE